MRINGLLKTHAIILLTLLMADQNVNSTEVDDEGFITVKSSRKRSKSAPVRLDGPVLPLIEIRSTDKKEVRMCQAEARVFAADICTLPSLYRSLEDFGDTSASGFINYANALRHLPLIKGKETDPDDIAIKAALTIYDKILSNPSTRITARNKALCHLGKAKILGRQADNRRLERDVRRALIYKAYMEGHYARELQPKDDKIQEFYFMMVDKL